MSSYLATCPHKSIASLTVLWSSRVFGFPLMQTSNEVEANILKLLVSVAPLWPLICLTRMPTRIWVNLSEKMQSTTRLLGSIPIYGLAFYQRVENLRRYKFAWQTQGFRLTVHPTEGGIKSATWRPNEQSWFSHHIGKGALAYNLSVNHGRNVSSPQGILTSS